jgi:nitrite reductase/ring-hydroxylating ferredoxin subunit
MIDKVICELTDIADGDHRIFMVDALEFGVFRQGEKVYAWENRCPHQGGPVCQGKIYPKVDERIGPDGKSLGMCFTGTRQIVCPWHGYEFNVATGRHPADPNVRLRPVNVTLREGRIYLQPQAR